MKKKSIHFPWFLAIRPKTLAISSIPVLIGTLIAAKEVEKIDWRIAFFAWMCATMIQIATNLINDLLDFKKGADKTRLGPIRVVQMGLISPQQIFIGIIGTLLLAMIFGIPLVERGGNLIALLLSAAILSAYLYTGGPRPLAYCGLGEIFVLLFFGWVSAPAVVYLQTFKISWPALIAGTQTGLFAVVILAVNNLRDMENDARVGKNTLAVLFGKQFGRFEIAIAAFLPFLFGIYWILIGNVNAALLPLATLPLAVNMVRGIWMAESSRVYNTYFSQAGLLHLFFGLLLAAGCL